MSGAEHPNLAQVISPQDLAAIVAKSQSGGFHATALPDQRGGGVFRPADFTAAPKLSAMVQPRLASDTDAEKGGADTAPSPAVAVKTVPERDFDGELARARAEGFAKGQVAGHAEGLAEGIEQGRLEGAALAASQAADDGHAQTNAARQAFLMAAQTVVEQSVTRELVQSLEAAVLRLASERAGIAITENPEPFRRRVIALADRVGQTLRSVKVEMSASDFDAVMAALDGPLPEGVTLVPSPSLARGDIIAISGGIRAEDLLVLGPEVDQ